jgi:glycosyltransferase involved in cell wall biosynthesis
VFNRRDLLAASIQSVLAQADIDYEMVIVDNASTDGTWAVCRSFAERDHRVRLFRNEQNVGPVRNWLRGVQEAGAPLVKLLFSDDVLEPTFLRRAVPLMSDSSVGFVFTAIRASGIDDADGAVHRWRRARGGGIHPSGSFIRDALFSTGACPHSPAAALFRRDDVVAALKADIPSPTYDDFAEHGGGPDLLVYLLTARRYPSVAYVDEPLVRFRNHPGSITASRRYPDLFNRYHQARIYFATEHCAPAVRRRLLAQAWIQNCVHRRRLLKVREEAARFVADGEYPRAADLAWALGNELRRTPHYAKRLRQITASWRAGA